MFDLDKVVSNISRFQKIEMKKKDKVKSQIDKFEEMSKTDDGLYLWILEKQTKIPVAHQIPYDKKKHEQLDNLKQEIQDGEKGIIQGITNRLQDSHFVLYRFDQRPDMEKNSTSQRFPGRPDLREN